MVRWQVPAAMDRRAPVLLKADAAGPDSGWSDVRIGEAFGCSFMTVRRVRQQFVAEGLDVTLRRRRPTFRYHRKLDGKREARLAACTRGLSPLDNGAAGRATGGTEGGRRDPAMFWQTRKTTSSRD